MEGSTVGAPPQRVCPKCARISWATGPQCPYCTARFRSGRGVRPWMLVVAVVVVLLGLAGMFVIAGNILENRVDDRIEEVNKDFDASLNKFRVDVTKELDARIPTTGAGTGADSGGFPTPTPFPSPTAEPTTTPDPAATATATASPSATATNEASPTETPREEIRP